MAAASRSEEIKGLILLYPAFVIPDDARERYSSPSELPETYTVLGMTIGKAYGEGLYDYDIYEAVKVYDKDVLIIHGDEDTIVPLSYSERAVEVYPSAELKVIRGAGHGFFGEADEEAAAYVKEYLKNH